MSGIVGFFKNWTLPISMVAGVLVYLAFANIEFLSALKPAAHALDRVLTPGFIFTQLLLTFCKVNPREFRFRRWHFILLGVQLASASACALSAALGFHPALSQGAMVCLICPTATAAAVITAKLGGSAETLITYTFLVNILAALFVPLVFPLVYAHEGMEFAEAFHLILSKVFPLLICPFLVSQLLRFAWKAAHDWLRANAGAAFYIWACALALVMGKTAKSIVDDAGEMRNVILLALVSLAACVIQFLTGKIIGGHYGERVSGGQAIGQKNTVLAIWMSYTYLLPITSVAPGAYVLWQNIINSYQLWKKRKRGSLRI